MHDAWGDLEEAAWPHHHVLLAIGSEFEAERSPHDVS
jgi:hypothetical protein